MCASELHLETCAFGADLRQLPLVDIAPQRADGPERGGGIDPGGLCTSCFLHIGLDVWVDLRGRGRQLCACHASRVLPPAENGQYVFFLLVSKWAQLATYTAGKPHPGLTGGARRRTKTVSLPVASRGPQTH